MYAPFRCIFGAFQTVNLDYLQPSQFVSKLCFVLVLLLGKPDIGKECQIGKPFWNTYFVVDSRPFSKLVPYSIRDANQCVSHNSDVQIC